MTKRIADLTCPKCQEAIQVPFDAADPPTLAEITSSLQEALKGQPGTEEIQKIIEGLKPQTEDHRHKTADEFFSCPECLSWVEKTGPGYQVSPKAPEKEAETPEPAVGSIFSQESQKHR